ncbi:PTPLA-domain-containing protein [Viridothelium virens]|uniref:Very-long-chain (3R)-3-hydroxyacyl-CoA dehydratase n=1 Tax=Viridothelium virens TaxID=1048519 RepID=A0A6A6HKZ2_VIRVR|nr:PTPLA-domain-containing protein [Viridothelium virens]
MADSSRSTARPPPQTSLLKARYLTFYNFISAVLWFTVLGRTTLLIPLVGYANIHGGVGNFARWTQTLALMEILHSATGLVRAPLPTTALQVASRLLLIQLIVPTFPHTTTASPAYASMLVAWSSSEVVRYSYFAWALGAGSPRFIPGLLAWLRYNLFFVLYPLGIGSECWLVYRSIGPAGRLGAGWGTWVPVALWAVLAVYVPGSYVLYTHMMTQRRKVMKGKGRDE